VGSAALPARRRPGHSRSHPLRGVREASSPTHEIVRVYRSDVPPALDCWWCGAPARAVAVESHDRGRLVYANPVLCTICQGLMQLSGGGFANQDEAERRAENLALQNLITASRERRRITAPDN
jgi:hypothetical protein